MTAGEFNGSEQMSQGFTRMYNANVNLGEGGCLFSNRNNVVWTITHDTVEQHDILFHRAIRPTTATLPA